MACNITLFNYLGGTPDTGGSWILQSGGPMAVSINGGSNTTISNGNAVGSTHGVSIDVSGTDAGTYVFRYTVGSGSCSTTADVTITVQDGAVVAVPLIELTLCSDLNQTYNLMDLLNGGDGSGNGTNGVTQGGTWSGSGTAAAFVTSGAYVPGTADADDDTFNPSLVDLGTNTSVTAQYIYNVDNGDGTTPPGCDNCEATGTITFIITAAGDAGEDGAVTLCNDPNA